MDVNETDLIVNAVPPGWRVIAIAIPLRVIRVVADDLNITFHVEQYVGTAQWRVLSTHFEETAWAGLGAALQDLTVKQVRLREKIRLAQHEKRMAMIKAENPLGPN